MKHTELMILIILIFLLGSAGCQKEKTEIQDNIVFQDISKVLIAPNKDSIPATLPLLGLKSFIFGFKFY